MITIICKGKKYKYIKRGVNFEMNVEIEERIIDINVEAVIEKLNSLNATKVGEWNQKRYVYDFNPKRENEWIRLRTNGEKTTITYKNIEKNNIDGTKELEIEVSDFDNTNELLNILGYKAKAYQENKRVRFHLNDVEIDIDYWPLIPPYMEIEGKNIEDVKKIEELLKIDKNKVTTLNCQDIYSQIYGININEIKELRF